MERRKYEELTEFLEGNILEQWDKQKIKQLEKESKNFEVKHGTLYKKTNEKMLRVLKEDEIDTIMFMTHNHSTGGHFGKGAIYNKINTRF